VRVLKATFGISGTFGYLPLECLYIHIDVKARGDPMQKEENSIKIFEDRKIRAHWDAENEEWYFSIVDVCSALTDQPTQRDASNYWAKLKQRLKKEGSEVLTNCQQLKMLAPDSKMRDTDVFDTKGILRAIQSIPSKKAEPFKMWMAKVASERLDEIADPEKAIMRGADYYRAKGYTEGWINQRLQTIEMRKELTDEWKAKGIEKERDYAILTNEMTHAWSGMSVKEYKEFKDLKKENLRDNMTNIEFTLNQLAEVTTTLLSKELGPRTFEDSKHIAIRGGKTAKRTRQDIEGQIGRSIISPVNAKSKELLEVDIKLIEEKEEE